MGSEMCIRDSCVTVPILRNNSQFDTVQMLHDMFVKIPHSSDSDPLFMRMDFKGNSVPLLRGWFVKRLKKWVKYFDLDPTDYSMHSLRKGGFKWCLQAGISLHLAIDRGDWKSSAWKAYLAYDIDDRVAMAGSIANAVSR